MKKSITSSSTKFRPEDKNRNINILIASDAINNKILKPNEEFSFNEILGERTLEKGYKIAHSINNKKVVDSVGGGICQVSTTLHMAAKKAFLKITEVHKHSIPVFYAKREDEASVSWGELDFKFINNLDCKIMIESIIDEKNSIITVNIFEI